MKKLFTDQTAFERMREHRDAIHVEEVRALGFPDYSLPEKLSDITRGAFFERDQNVDEKMLSLHHNQGVQNEGKNEFALDVPDDDLKYADQERKLSDGSMHKYDLNGLYADLPPGWAEKPAPKKVIE